MRLVLVFLAFVLLMNSAPNNNPLLKKQYRIPFDQIKPEHVEPAIASLLEEAQKKREAYIASRAPRTYDNTMAALESLSQDLDQTMGVVRHLDEVASTPAWRAAVNVVLPKVTAFTSSIPLDGGIYAKIQEYAATPEAQALTGARQRFLKVTLDDFRRRGAGLPEAQRTRLREINVELSKLNKQFSDNVLDATNAFELVIKDDALLAGLPESARSAARQSAKQKGLEGWRFTLQEPSLRAVLTYLDDAGIRERIYRASNTRATHGVLDNRPVMRRILELRRERAALLGYHNFADLVTEDRMAKSGARVREFLATLETKTRPFYERENRELMAFRRSLEGAQAAALAPWDLLYYAEKMRHAKYDFDEELLRPYFPMESVMRGMFELVERLYGVKITPVDGVPAWNAAVKYFEVRDVDGSLLGSFYADFYPREDKRGGAWSDGLITGGPMAGGFEPHLGVICGNLTPPVGGKPALLTKRDVETIFHEFGHQLHHILSRVPVKSLNEVAWDFVELPSQIMENFTWERGCLDLFARHYETGAPIPEELYQKMVRARTFRAAYAQMRQLSFGTADLNLHVDYAGEQKDGDILDYSRRVFQRFMPVPLPSDYGMVASFTHIFSGGYAAGYYSYKWAEVLDADAFTRFQKEGIFSRAVGMDFRRQILEKGNLEDAAKLFHNFMGRDPDPEALLRRSGLVAKP
jgi:oligopeptidase A